MTNMIINLFILLAITFLMGFSIAFLYVVRRSKLIHRKTGVMLKDSPTEQDAGIIEGRLQVTGELLDILKFKKIK